MAGGSAGRGEWLVAGLGPGSVIAGYRVEDRIGAGGMAMVLRAHDEALGRTVALKVLAPALASDQDFRQRFVREARAVAAVDHPHIIPVYSAGEAGGVLYLAMRYVTGGDLRAVVQREGPLPGHRALDLLSPVAAALDAAHRATLVHRDVKPANILIDAGPDRPEHPYLSDFGLAKGSSASAGLTGTGQYVGTPDYSAPEQISGKPTGPRTDQYALACVAYTILAGTLPYPREESMAVLWAHMHEPPPRVTSKRRDLPAAVDQALGRALAKSPDDRYATCGEFIGALRAALAGSPRASGTGSPRASGVTATGTRPAETAQPAVSPQQRRADRDAAPAPSATQSVASPPGSAAGWPGTGRPPWDPGTSRAQPMTASPATKAPVAAPGTITPGGTAVPSRVRHRRAGRITRFRLIAAGAALLVLVLGGGFYGFWQYNQGQYYVGIDYRTRNVAIFQGTSQSLAGISLSSLYTVSTLKASQVAPRDQPTLVQTISEGSLRDAEQKVNQLAGDAAQCRQTYQALASWKKANDKYQTYLAAKANFHGGQGAREPTPVPAPGVMPGQLPSASQCAPSTAFGIAATALPSQGETEAVAPAPGPSSTETGAQNATHPTTAAG